MRNRNAPPDKFMLCYVGSVLYCGDNVLSSIFLFFHRKKSLSQSLNGVSIPPEPLNKIQVKHESLQKAYNFSQNRLRQMKVSIETYNL